MPGIDEIIPAFSSWKMINDTIPVLMKGECSEASVKRLATIIQSKECSNIFICAKDPMFTFEQYQEISEKYKTFTTWLLGQFFYLLGCERFSKLHDVIIETQFCVLDHVSSTQLQYFQEFSSEYSKAFDNIINYYKQPGEKLILQIFVPKKFEDLNSMLDLSQVFMEISSKKKAVLVLRPLIKFIKYILTENFTFYSFDEFTCKNMNNLLFLFSEVIDDMQLDITEIFLDILKMTNHKFEEYSVDLRSTLISFFSLFEQFVYKTYDSIDDEKNMNKFETLLISYMKLNNDLKCSFKNINRIYDFIFNICIINNKKYPSESVQKVAIETSGILTYENSKLLSNVDNIIQFTNTVSPHFFKQQIYDDLLAVENLSVGIKAFDMESSKVWSLVHDTIMRRIVELKCVDSCNMYMLIRFFKSLSDMLMEIQMSLIKAKGYRCILYFFEERKLLLTFIEKTLSHGTRCEQINVEHYFNFFLLFILITNSRNLDIIFNFLGFSLLKNNCYKNDNQFPNNFISDVPVGDLKMVIKSFYNHLSSQNINRNVSLRFLKKFFTIVSSGLLNVNFSQIKVIEKLYLKISKSVLESSDQEGTIVVIETLPYILNIFEEPDVLITDIWRPIFTKQNKEILEKATAVFSNILCCISSDFIKIVKWNNMSSNLDSMIICNKCTFNELKGNKNNLEKIASQHGNSLVANCSKITLDQSLATFMLKHVLSFVTGASVNLKIEILSTLPNFSSHILQFHSTSVAKIWVELVGDQNKDVRRKFAHIIGKTLKFNQENAVLAPEIKMDVLNILFSSILKYTKKSLKFSDYELQDTLLDTIEVISTIKSEHISIELMKILFYLIMVPTSKYSMIAVNKCFKLAERNNTSTSIIYSQNKKVFCEVIVQLCSVNQALINYGLSTSLEKVSVMLGYYGCKDFVTQESNYLLPFLVSKIVKMPAVTKLIQEMASMMDTDVSEMVSSKYGYVFIYIFLDMSRDDLRKCMIYLERTTGMSGPSLRKRNFRIILNELLLNFHERRDKVVQALSLLSNEDSENKSKSIPDYLHSHFLGVLLYFDGKLISKNSKKDKFLLSLADLFRFMGSKHIMPLRFKIIAMLQTTNYGNFPNLTCEVWNSFVHTCEIESLGPQLALIFVSVIPLLESCPKKINDIFKYLIIENEATVKSYIPDLFFVKNPKVDHEVLLLIKNYLKPLEKCTLKEKISRFLKYLTHEAMEVRIQGLKQLKTYLEQSREELDQMILDYNGIDPIIIELIDLLTLGCREKDEALKLACGEVIGELGAIEPSHIPRRYVHEEKSFSFYMNEDSFVVSSLNELIRAFQTEQNTQNLDRYALAIQEMLRAYEISPDTSSKKFSLWEDFPDSQKEIILPLLSSRYMISHCILPTNLPSPIYGSNSGASFQSWLFNFTSSLISSLPHDKIEFLKVILPSMKQDKRVLMHFLPHILLHSLLEGNDRIAEKCLIEIQTITSSFTRKKSLEKKALGLRPIPISGLAVEPQVITPEEVKRMQCTKVVFLLLDFLDRWVREWQWQKGVVGISNEHFRVLKHFQKELCKLQLAKCNYHCGEYPRALMYLEDYVRENKNELYNHLTFLAEIYAQLEEPDGVAGVTALQLNEPSVEQRILALEVSGKLADATTCYERMLQPLKLHHIQGLVQCYLDLDNVNTALNFVKGALDIQPEFGNMLLEMQAEPLWRLGQYDDLDKLLKTPDVVGNTSWGVQVGKALLHFKNGERSEFSGTVDGILKQQVLSFGAASLEEGAYQHGYGYISKLHALNELQQVEKVISDLLVKPFDQRYAENLMKKLMNDWTLRIKVVEESVRIIEPLLCLRRVSLGLAKKIAEDKINGAVPYLNSLIGDCWLQSARIARASGMHQQAFTYTVKAEEYAPPTLFLEKAKLHWLREEHEQAFTTLRRGLEVIIPECSTAESITLEQRKLCAEAKLLVATYNDEISNVDAAVNLKNYVEATNMFNQWEKSMVCLAQFYDKQFQNFSEAERDSQKGGDHQVHMINFFGKSLQYGSNYVYQSMPRLLSIWFDYGTRLLDVTQSTTKEERKCTLMRMTKLIDSFLDRLPPYVFLTAFSQLVSRICHPQKEVYVMLKSIIIKLVQHYPQQSLWMIISVVKSSYSVRSKRCAEMLCDPRLKTNTFSKLLKDFTSLAEKLIELCNKELPSDDTKHSVSSLLRSLPRLLAKDDFSEIMMPTYKFRKLILPNPDFTSTQHNPFPNHYVHIVGIEDEMNILPSLQRPRKITLKGSDGKRYIYMLKPKDDLRKDFRLMEFNDIVNQLLSREGEARQRRLNIRLYSVAPLNEECGLIEWVSNLVGIRPILVSLYKQRGISMNSKALKEASANLRDTLERKRELFTKKLLAKHPPILGDWFRKTFPDAQSWLTARTAYVRTTAVMSMVGYILGLGDRHGENILLDSTCGDVVHVDFNCLFNKGEKFDWPERVPFRLTHNMVAAMGPLGVEGIFRKSCACTLRVLRMNANTLMSIVAPFVYDPLVSWPRNVPALASLHNAERTNEEALDHIKNLELRLQGRARYRTISTPLSVEGQTNYLINEAVNIDNLCQMYVGWGAYY
ncbi:serine/threonine-protein kinase atr isoform X2 [Leptinotarsa decemlineata]|uniref:serine/threonine-protein kinase atr isoform X2 n=1 Tax=Leptinotarsa decemlineata TaxID=7539 RepID=UPI003D3066C9